MEQKEYKEMENVEKTHFWFVAKRKFLQIILDKYVPLRNIKILDVGCGTGAVLDFLKDRGFIVEGVDNNEEALKYCRNKNLSVTLGSAEKMEYPDETFDLVLALDVLEHLSDPALAVKEVFRVLKKGGLFIATVPAHQWLWSYHDVALHHYKRYSKKDFEFLLEDQFSVLLVTWVHLCILLPTILIRKIYKIFNKQTEGSDVGEIGFFVNVAGRILYWPELLFFKFFRKLPAGLSLLAVAEKK